jgi:hypothetical protein
MNFCRSTPASKQVWRMDLLDRLEDSPDPDACLKCEAVDVRIK